MTRLLLPLVLMLVLTAQAPAQDAALEKRLAELAKAHNGKVAYAAKHLGSGECLSLLGDEPMPTASLIKFPIMLELYLLAAEGKIKLTDMVTLTEKDKVPGSGILTYHFTEGATFSLRDACRLMIVYSDNTATNLILDKIGIPSTNKRMAAWGLEHTRINAKVFLGAKTSVDPERSKKFGLGSTSANEMIRLLEKVHKGDVVDRKTCDAMLDHLKKCDDKTKLKRLLPAGTVVAHKTGSVSDVKTDAGIIYTPGGPIAMCVLTWQNDDKRFADDNAASILIGQMARAVYDHFSAVKKK